MMYINMIIIAILLTILFTPIRSFYLPGVAPHSFTNGEPVELKVNKLRYQYYYIILLLIFIIIFLNPPPVLFTLNFHMITIL